MLSNSSLALENIIHDSHQHDAESSAVEMHDATKSTGVTDTLKTSSAMSAADHADEYCVCDELCCVSSIEIASAGSDTIHPGLADSNLDRDNLYQSIALNLLLHPPTA